MFYKMYSLVKFIIVVGVLFIVLQLYSFHYISFSKVVDKKVPVILWWTPFGNDGMIKKCGNNQCYFTYNRTFENDPHLKSILFYGSNVRVDDLPTWRSAYVSWGFIHEESPRNNPLFVHEEMLNLFNYSSTFSRYSNLPLNFIDLPDMEDLLGKKYFVPTETKTALMEKENLAPVLYIQSDCNTATDRDSYVRELMKYIKVDSYGSCLNNVQLGKMFKDNYLDTLNTYEFQSFVAKYKFTLAFENAVCNDYITEKLWRPLIVGSVPIYYGSVSFKEWLPYSKSAISVLDFPTPDKLAKFISNLIKNDSQYEQYLFHKLGKLKVINSRLLNLWKTRSEKRLYDFGSYVETFECLICNKIHNTNKKEEIDMVSTKHYDCPLPRNPLSGKVNQHNFWVHQWVIEKCGAKLLKHYILNNITFNINQYNSEKLKLYIKNNC